MDVFWVGWRLVYSGGSFTVAARLPITLLHSSLASPNQLQIYSFPPQEPNMIRHPRSAEPDPITVEIGQILAPLTVFPWGPLAMHYLGVPIVIGVSMAITS